MCSTNQTSAEANSLKKKITKIIANSVKKTFMMSITRWIKEKNNGVEERKLEPERLIFDN